MDKAGNAKLWDTSDSKWDRDKQCDVVLDSEHLEQALSAHRPIAIVDDSILIVPVRGQNQNWNLREYDIQGKRFRNTLRQVHIGEVTSLVSGPLGLFASADRAGHVYVWKRNEQVPLQIPRTDERPAVSLSFHPSGEYLALGKTRMLDGRGGEMQLWDIDNQRVIHRRPLADNVYGCAISPNGKYLAYCGGASHEVFVENLPQPGQPVAVAGGTRVSEVRFRDTDGDPPVRFQIENATSGSGWYGITVDGGKVKVRDSAPPKNSTSTNFGAWSYRDLRLQNRVELYQNGVKQGYVPINLATEGRVQCVCWLPGANGEPRGIVVGTDIDNQIYVYDLPIGGKQARLLRYFSRSPSDRPFPGRVRRLASVRSR